MCNTNAMLDIDKQRKFIRFGWKTVTIRTCQWARTKQKGSLSRNISFMPRIGKRRWCRLIRRTGDIENVVVCT